MIGLCLGMDLLRRSRAMQLFSQLSHRYEFHTAEESQGGFSGSGFMDGITGLLQVPGKTK